MKNFLAAAAVEWLKLRRSTIFRLTLAAAAFIALMLALMMWLAMHPDLLPPGILKTKVAIAALVPDWPNYLAFTGMAAGAIGLIVFGFAASWIFGREYADRTVKDLLALPTPRSAVVAGKLAVLALWCLLIAAAMAACALAAGLPLGLPRWSPALLPPFLGVMAGSSLLSILLCPPAALAASAGRGVLPGVGFTLLAMGLANFFGNLGLGEVFPWTVPMLYSGAVGEAGARLPLVSYLVVAAAALAGTVGLVVFWRYADQAK
jgi:ABC-2 type transport system permease protein